MKFKHLIQGLVATASIMTAGYASAITPGAGWADSYSANGKCYCASTFDHGIGGYKVNTPAGQKTVREVCSKIGKGPGKGGNPVYNTVQCGHEPGHNDAININGKWVKDEKVCPGRVDQGSGGCNKKGPKWDLSVFGNGGGDNGGGNNGGGNNGGKCWTTGNNRAQATSSFKNKCGGNPVDCDPSPGGKQVCANYQIPNNNPPTGDSGGNNGGGNNGGGDNGLAGKKCYKKGDPLCHSLNGGWCNVWKEKANPICYCGGNGPCK